MTYLPVNHESAWRADACDIETLTVELGELELMALARATEIAETSGLPVMQVSRNEFDLSAIGDHTANWVHRVMHGHGLLRLRGLAALGLESRQLEFLHWGLGLVFGTAMSQSVMGDRLGHVVNVSGKDQNQRAYRNSTGLAMHTDSCDVVAMMCLQPALQGGLSGYVSAIACYNEFLARRPDLLPLLVRGFHYHRFGEEAPGESPVTEEPVPVFSFRDGLLSVNYLRSYIDMAAQEAGHPLTPAETEALDLMDDIVHDPRLAISVMAESADVVVFNNRTILHNRTAFEDSPRPEEKRHFLRLWLVAHEPRPTVDALGIYEGGGIEEQAGKSTYFAGRLKYREFSGGAA